MCQEAIESRNIDPYMRAGRISRLRKRGLEHLLTLESVED